MSKKTIEIGGIDYELPFCVDYTTLNVPTIRDQAGCPLYRAVDNDDLKAIVTALNFQHVTFPAMVAKVREEIESCQRELLNAEVIGLGGAVVIGLANTISGMEDVLKILEANDDKG